MSSARRSLTTKLATVAIASAAAFGGTFIATFETPLNSKGADAALANHVPNPNNFRPCAEYYEGGSALAAKAAQITETVYNVTGNYATEDVCDVNLYNDGVWSTQAELQGYVDQVMNSCNGTSGLSAAQSRNLTMAVVQKTGIVPAGNVCKHDPYSARYAATCSGAGCNGINWSVYDDDDPALQAGQRSALAGVSSVLSMCGSGKHAQAIVQVTGQLPQSRLEHWGPYPTNDNAQTAGQCNRGLYNNGVYYSYLTPTSLNGQQQPRGLLQAVQARVNSTGACTISQITTAYQELTGWRPLGSGNSGECDPRRYGFGSSSWSSNYTELKRLVAMSFRCFDPWISQVYASDFNRGPRSLGGDVGECSPGLYGRGYTGTGDYGTFRDRVTQTQNVMSQRGLVFNGNQGDLNVTYTLQGIPQTYELKREFVLMASDPVYLYRGNGIISDKGLGVIAAGGGNLNIDFSSPVIAAGGGNVIAAGGGNVISLGSGNVIAAGGGNVIAAGGANVIAAGGGNVIAAGGGNVMSAGNGN